MSGTYDKFDLGLKGSNIFITEPKNSESLIEKCPYKNPEKYPEKKPYDFGNKDEITLFSRELIVIPVPETEPPITRDELVEAAKIQSENGLANTAFPRPETTYVAEITADQELVVGTPQAMIPLLGAEYGIGMRTIGVGRFAIYEGSAFFNTQQGLTSALEQVVADRSQPQE